ncbi:MAG: hypothetical protein OEU54_11865 [Gemmatimonadota bacterium]|nr:hypothetical protein [Gemmatimonadota bacterium]
MRKLYLAGLTFLAAVLWIGVAGSAPDLAPSLRYLHPTVVEYTPRGTAAQWFAEMRQFCNPVEVDTRHDWTPPPTAWEGTAFSAACFSLAGNTDRARELIDGLQGDERWQAAGIVFNVGHSVADAGNDRAAGPIMELVVEFWPNHYMALYHAGMARLGLGDEAAAADYLERFLEHYSPDDGWTSSARTALEEIAGR